MPDYLTYWHSTWISRIRFLPYKNWFPRPKWANCSRFWPSELTWTSIIRCLALQREIGETAFEGSTIPGLRDANMAANFREPAGQPGAPAIRHFLYRLHRPLRPGPQHRHPGCAVPACAFPSI